jgi:signal transduction histidine kinase
MRPLPRLGRLQRKVLIAVSIIVLVPMLAAGWLAAEWVSSSFEARLERWIRDAARANESWLEAYQNDAVMLGRVLADDAAFVEQMRRNPEEAMPQAVRRIGQELGVTLLQVYSRDLRLLYSSIPLEVKSRWESGQTEAVLKVVRRGKSLLAAVGITPVPRRGAPEYYLVLGSLLGADFTKELNQLTGMTARLYYREGGKYYNLFTTGAAQALGPLPAAAIKRLEKDKKPYYAETAENGRYRGQYTPIVDSTGHVEAVMFSGLERRGPQEVLTNQVAMFLAIVLLGLAIGALTGLLLSRLVLRPLGLLRDGVMQLAGQNFDATVPIASDDELGDLAKAFNAMAARLRAARDEQASRHQADKLAAMGEMSAALAHEIRNPLGVISTSAAMLERHGADAEKSAQLVRMIREESARVSQLMQDFLHLSRHRQPEFALTDPAAPLERALELALAGREGVSVHKDFRHDRARIRADGGLLTQAWGNILHNSLQAMDGRPGAELRVASRLDNGEVLVSVEDNGPGVPPEILPRLFEPFFTTKETGTGLGLTIAHTLVDANGGRLEALVPEGRGARFAMRFRAHTEAT